MDSHELGSGVHHYTCIHILVPAWSSGGTVLEVKMYLQQNGNRSLLLAVQVARYMTN